MLIIGCDYHPGFQQIALVDTETGECGERRLTHREEAEQFYRTLTGQDVRVGMEASGHARWFEGLLRELQFELWIGDAAEIRTKRVRKQKTDRPDAQLLLRLLIEDRFPRIWVPDAENRDLRQLLWHRHRLVQMRTRVMNQLHVVALNEGLRRKKALWRAAGRQDLRTPRPEWSLLTIRRSEYRVTLGCIPIHQVASSKCLIANWRKWNGYSTMPEMQTSPSRSRLRLRRKR